MKLITSVVLLLVVLIPAFAQQDSATVPHRRQGGGLNGREWQSFAYLDKFHYLLGSTDAIIEAAPAEYSKYFEVSGNLNFEEFAKALDRFYQEPENLPIPIIWACRIVTMKANGANAAEIDGVLATMRRQAVQGKE